MTTQGSYHNCSTSIGDIPQLNTFSAINLLKNYNQILIPTDFNQRYRQLITQGCTADDYKLQMNPLFEFPNPSFSVRNNSDFLVNNQTTFLSHRPIIGYQHIAPLFAKEPTINSGLERKLINSSTRRQRGEKKPIPDEQKDDKYFERRRRNNQAAKKSRDARKMREDQIAFRATMLEHENALLRAQILTLREEATSLRQLLLGKKTEQNSTLDHQINCR